MKRLLGFVLYILTAQAAFAQFTSVTATITDSDSQTWNNGKWAATLYNPFPANPPSIGGVPLTNAQLNLGGALSNSGVLTASMADNTQIAPTGTQWQFTICPNASTQCSPVMSTVTGSSENLSTQLSSQLRQLRFPASPTAFGYLDVEVYPIPLPGGQYFNVSSLVARVWNGTTWQNGNSASLSCGSIPNGVCSNNPGATATISNANYTYNPSTNVTTTATPTSSCPNIKTQFNAIGNGTTDDTAAIQAAQAYIAANGGCIFFPPGAYKTTAELSWLDQSNPLTFYGSGPTSYIIYLGTSTIDSTILVGNAADNAFSAINFQNIGIAANSHANYALHLIRMGPSTNMDNVPMMGGSISTLECQFCNGQADLRNLIVSGTAFAPSGASACVNGLTFDYGPAYSTTFVSSQFTLTMPTVNSCTGIGLNMPNVVGVTVNNAQLSGNHQQLYVGCLVNCPANSGNTFNSLLLEDSGGEIASEIHSNGNNFNNLAAGGGLKIYGDGNTFIGGQFSPLIESGATGNGLINVELCCVTPTDAGTGSYGIGTYGPGFGAVAAFNIWPGSLGAPTCTGYIPINGQFVKYTTGGTPNPCYSAGPPLGYKGTFTCTGGGTVTILNAHETAISDVVISMNTPFGTISTAPAMKTVTAGTGFAVLCGAADTSIYNYDILN